nr:hypothetical protein [Tanacetum cinerariifolium]
MAPLIFADTHNMIAFLTKFDASEGFDQIVDFLNAHYIQYTLMVNPTIYVSYIKQFWASVWKKKSNDVMKLQALIDRKKVIITQDSIRQALRLDDADVQDDVAKVEEDKDNEVYVAPTPPSFTPTTTPPPPQQEPIPSPPQAQSAQPSSPPQQQPSQTTNILESSMTLLNKLMETCATLTKKVVNLEQDKIAQALEITKLKQRAKKLEKQRGFKSLGGCIQTVGEIDELDANEAVTLVDVDVKVEIDANIQGRMVESHVKVYNLDLQHFEKVLSMQDTDETEPAKVEEVLEVVIAAKLMTEVVTTAAPITTVAQVPKANASRKRRGVVIQDPEETAAALVIIEIRPIFEKHYNSIQAFLKKGEEEVTVQEEGSNRKGKSLKQETTKKQRIDKEEMELKRHIQIVVNDDDDVYTKSTHLASKVPIVDYQIHHEKNKPYYKIIRADRTHKLFLSVITLLKKFDKEDLETLWKLVKERFKSIEPNNFSNDFLLNTLKITFEKPNVKANMILLVEKKYPLTHFTLEQMLNNVRLEVEEESEVSLELLRKCTKGLLLLIEELGLLVLLMLFEENDNAAEEIKKLL